jgi:transposase-like protein
MKNYQTSTRRAGYGRATPKKASTGVDRDRAVVLPETVTLAVTELAGEIEEGLLALAVGTGLQVLAAFMQAEVTELAGPKGRWNKERKAVRHGLDDGEVTLGGRRVPITRPRVRSADRSEEVKLETYELFSSTEVLGRLAMERMLAKLSTRRYGAGLEPVGTAVEKVSRSTSRSSVSRRFVAATEEALTGLLARDISSLDLVVVMIDGVRFAGHTCVVALGIDADGVKHPLSLEEGDTENAVLVKDLLASLRERGLDTERPTLFVLDGAKALHAGVKAVFGKALIQRCQLHKIRNVRDKLPDHVGAKVEAEIRAAYRNPDPKAAEAILTELARRLDKSHPGAAGSLREGLAETLTITRLGVPPSLARTLRSTNPIESMIEICRDHSRNVKRWRDGEMALRWCAAGMLEAEKQFRRVNGHLHMKMLKQALGEHFAATDTPPRYGAGKEAAA